MSSAVDAGWSVEPHETFVETLSTPSYFHFAEPRKVH